MKFVKSGAGNLRATFAWPLALAVATLAGLIAALLGDGWWDAAAAVVLSVPAAIALRALCSR